MQTSQLQSAQHGFAHVTKGSTHSHPKRTRIDFNKWEIQKLDESLETPV